MFCIYANNAHKLDIYKRIYIKKKSVRGEGGGKHRVHPVGFSKPGCLGNREFLRETRYAKKRANALVWQKRQCVSGPAGFTTAENRVLYATFIADRKLRPPFDGIPHHFVVRGWRSRLKLLVDARVTSIASGLWPPSPWKMGGGRIFED